jgi:hypothetical protein
LVLIQILTSSCKRARRLFASASSALIHLRNLKLDCLHNIPSSFVEYLLEISHDIFYRPLLTGNNTVSIKDS